MTDQNRGRAVDRRTVLGGVGSLAVAGLVAGCTTSTQSGDGGDGGSPTADGGGGGGGDVPSEVSNYLSDVSNFDGSIEDMTGQDQVTVTVGAEGNNGNYAFGPPAIRVDSGTTVQFEWNGKGGQHNVVSEGGDYESELYSEAGTHFEYTYEESGVHQYFCRPHKPLGMKGVVVLD